MEINKKDPSIMEVNQKSKKMMEIKIVLFLYLVMNSISGATSETILKKDNTCNKTHFIETVIQHDSYLNLTKHYRQQMRDKCGNIGHCYSADLSMTLLFTENSLQYKVNVANMQATYNLDCWGYIVIIEKQNKGNITKNFYNLNFNQTSTKLDEWSIDLPDSFHRAKVVTIPSMLEKNLETVNKSTCQKEVLIRIMGLGPVECKDSFDVRNIIRKFASPLCYYFPDREKRNKEIDNYFNTMLQPCTFIYYFKPQALSSNKNQLLMKKLTKALIAVSTILISICGFFIIRKLWRTYCQHMNETTALVTSS